MQTTIQKMGAGVFVLVVLAVITALAWEGAVINVIYVIKDLLRDHLSRPFAEIFEFVARFFWALLVTALLVVVAMRQGKKEPVT